MSAAMTPEDGQHPLDASARGAMAYPVPEERRCCATAKSTGNRCGRRAIPGGRVCVKHGGAAPQVQQRARLRLIELVEPAIAVLAREMAQADKSADRQRAANSLLDRAGGFGREINTDDPELLQTIIGDAILKAKNEYVDEKDFEVIVDAEVVEDESPSGLDETPDPAEIADKIKALLGAKTPTTQGETQ